MEGVGFKHEERRVVKSIIKPWSGIDVHSPISQAPEWDTSFCFLSHLINHSNNVCIWQKAFWKHVEYVGGILEYKEEFVPSDQEARKCWG